MTIIGLIIGGAIFLGFLGFSFMVFKRSVLMGIAFVLLDFFMVADLFVPKENLIIPGIILLILAFFGARDMDRKEKPTQVAW